MREYPSDIAFTPAVKAVQKEKGSLASYDKVDPGQVERAIVLSIEAWDINCPQHIEKQFSQREVQPVIEQLQRRISELEALLAHRQAQESIPSPA